MSTSRFQLALIVALSICLGLSVQITDAIGYPASAVSLGENPVFSTGGSVGPGATETALIAPEGMDYVITDLSLGVYSTHHYCKQLLGVRLSLDDGTVLGRYGALLDVYRHGGLWSRDVSMNSGIRVPAGQNLNISTEVGATEGCTGQRLDYTLSGYTAQR